MVSKVTETSGVGVSHNVLKAESGVTERQARLQIPGRRCVALKWVVENNRTGATRTFDNPEAAEAFFENEVYSNAGATPARWH